MDISQTLSTLFAQAPRIGLRGVLQFILPPDEALWVEVLDTARVGHGLHPSADTTITIGADHLAGIACGEHDVEQLFVDGRIIVDGNLGLATLLPQIIAAPPIQAAASDSTELKQRYAAPTRHSETLSANQATLRVVERRRYADLQIDEFHAHYVRNGIPLILGGALDDWPLFKDSREAALAHFAGLQGLTRHGDYVSKTFSTDRDFRSESMAAYISSLAGSSDPTSESSDTPPPYMGNNALAAQLLDQIRFPELFERSQFISPRIWIGPKGTLTPLHRDDSDNLFAQVWGSKSFTLAAPHHREALGAWSTSPEGGLDGCDFNPDLPDYQRFPLARDVVFLRVAVEAGDLLFIPEGWFHQVASLSVSLSVNFWVNSGRGWDTQPSPPE